MHIKSLSFSGRLAFLFLISAAFAVKTNAQKKINIDEGWKFHFGNAASD